MRAKPVLRPSGAIPWELRRDHQAPGIFPGANVLGYPVYHITPYPSRPCIPIFGIRSVSPSSALLTTHPRCSSLSVSDTWMYLLAMMQKCGRAFFNKAKMG